MKTLAFVATMLVAAVAGGQMTPAKLSALADSAVKVETYTAAGSGSVIGDGLVLTCAHVVKGAKAILVVTRTHVGTTNTLPAKVLRVDDEVDLALLSVRGLALPAVKLATADAPEFSTLWNISSPLGEERTVMAEILNKTSITKPGVWRLTGPLMQGASGGMVIDADGQIQCVFSAIWTKLWRGEGSHSGVMGECVAREAVQRFLKSPIQEQVRK